MVTFQPTPGTRAPSSTSSYVTVRSVTGSGSGSGHAAPVSHDTDTSVLVSLTSCAHCWSPSTPRSSSSDCAMPTASAAFGTSTGGGMVGSSTDGSVTGGASGGAASVGGTSTGGA